MLKQVQHDGRVRCCGFSETLIKIVTLNWFQGLFYFKNVMPSGLGFKCSLIVIRLIFDCNWFAVKRAAAAANYR